MSHDEECQYQVQLLSQIDGYRNVFQNLRNQETSFDELIIGTAFTHLHFLFCLEKYPLDKQYDGLTQLMSGTTLSHTTEIIPAINAFMENLEEITSSYMNLAAFVEENISKLMFWSALVMETIHKTPDADGAILLSETFIRFIRNLNERVTYIADTETRVVSWFTPRQHLTKLMQNLPVIKSMIDQASKATQVSASSKIVKALTYFNNILDKMSDDFNLALLDNDVILASIDYETLKMYRKEVAAFCFYTGYLDPIVKGEKFSMLVSEILYGIDGIMNYRAAMPNEETTPLDVSRAAYAARNVVQTVLGSPANAMVMVIQTQLVALDKLFNDVYAAYEETSAMRHPTERLAQFFDETADDIEVVQRSLIQGHFGMVAHEFIMSYQLLSCCLKKIRFPEEEELTDFDFEKVHGLVTNFDEQLLQCKKEIIQNFVTPIVELEVPDLLKYVVNPSRKARSAVMQATVKQYCHASEQSKAILMEKCKQTMEKDEEILNSLTAADSTILPEIRLVSQDLIECGILIDVYRDQKQFSLQFPGLDEQYHDLVKLFNMLVVGLIQTICIQPDIYSPYMGLRNSKAMIELVFPALQAAAIASPRVTRDAQDAEAQFREIYNRIEGLLDNYSEAKLASKLKELTKDVDTIATFHAHCKKYDHAARESALRTIIMHLEPAMMVIVMHAQKLESKPYQLIEIISDLNDTDNYFKEILNELTYGTCQATTRNALMWVAKALGSMSQIRTALAFPNPKKLLAPLTALRSQLETLPGLIRLVNPTTTPLDLLSSLSMARWKLGHLEPDYIHDRQLASALDQVEILCNAAGRAIGVTEFLEFFSAKWESLRVVRACLTVYSERSGNEKEEWTALFARTIQDITDNWKPPRTEPGREKIEQLRRQINNCIAIIAGDGARVQLEPLISPSSVFSRTAIEVYVSAAGPKFGSKDFYGLANQVIENPMLGKEMFDKIIKDFDLFIDEDIMGASEFQEKAAASLLYMIAYAKASQYKKADVLEKQSIEFVTSDSADIGQIMIILCNMLKSFREHVNPGKQIPELRQNQLLLGYLTAPSYADLAEIIYLSTISTIREVKELIPKFCLCAHKKDDISQIATNFATEALKMRLPHELQNKKMSADEEKKFVTESPIIISKRAVRGEDFDKGRRSELYIMNEWTKRALSGSSNDVKYMDPIPPHFNRDESTIYNEFNLPKEDESYAQSYFHVRDIATTVRSISNVDRKPTIPYRALGTLFKTSYERAKIGYIPSAPVHSPFGCVSVEAPMLMINESPYPKGYMMFYIMDIELRAPVTEPLYVKVVKGKAALASGGVSDAVFSLPYISDNLVMVCRLLSRKPPINELLRFIKGDEAITDFAFAATCVRLFDTDNNFVAKNFPDTFHAMITDNELADKFREEPINPVYAKLRERFTYHEKEPEECGFLWSRPAAKMVCNNILKSPFSSVPLITITNVTYKFAAAPNAQFLMFKAYLVEEDSHIMTPANPIPAIVYGRKDTAECYVSSMVPSRNLTIFPDVVRFAIDHRMKSTAHVILQLYTSSDGVNVTEFKTSFISLYVNDYPEAGPTVEYPMYNFNDLPVSGYLSAAKEHNSDRVQMRFTLPEAYFPTGPLADLVDAKTPPPTLNLKNFKPESAIGAILPVISRQLDWMRIDLLIQILAGYDTCDIASILKAWTYMCFSPLKYGDDFLNRFMKATTKYCNQVSTSRISDERNISIYQIVYSIPYLNDIVLMSILAHGKHVNTDAFAQAFDDYCSAITQIIFMFMSFHVVEAANKSLAEMILVAAPVLSTRTFLKAVKNYFTIMDGTKIVQIEGPSMPEMNHRKISFSQHPPSQRTLTLKRHFVDVMAHNSHLLARASEEKDSAVFKLIFNSMANASQYVEEMKAWIITVSEFTRTIEHYKSVAGACTAVFISFLKVAVRFVKHDLLATDYEAFTHFCIPVMYLLHAPASVCWKFFSALSDEDRLTFIDMLSTMIDICLVHEIKLEQVRSREEEMAQLKEKKSLIQKSVNIHLFSELTVRICGFVLSFKHMEFAEHLCPLLMKLFCPQQDRANYPHIALTVCKMIDMNAELVYTKPTRVYDTVMEMAIELCSRQMMAAKAAGVAIIIHLIYEDYNTTNDIALSSQYFGEKLLNAVEMAPQYKVNLHQVVIDRVALMLNSLHIDNLTSILKQRVEGFQSVFKTGCTLRGSNQSPDMRSEVMYGIATHFASYPVVRRHWLQRIVQVNLDAGLYSSAFIAELHIAAMTAQVIKQLNLGELPDLDFSFIPSTSDEESLDVRNLEGPELSVITSNFSVQTLIESLTNAVNHGRLGHLSWQIRPVYLLLLAVQEIRQEYNKLVTIAGGLADEYENIEKSNGVASLSFYLLDQRRNGKSIDMRVYCSRISDLDEFMLFLNDRAAQRFEFCEIAVGYNTLADAGHIQNGIIVTPIKSAVDFAYVDNTKLFVQDAIFENVAEWEAVARRKTTVAVKEALPNARSWSKVETIQSVAYNGIESLKLSVDNSIKLLQDQREGLMITLPNKPNLDVWRRAKPYIAIGPITRALKEALNVVGKRISTSLKNPGPHADEIMALAERLLTEIQQTLMVMNTAVDELQEKRTEAAETFSSLCAAAKKFSAETTKVELSFEPASLRTDTLSSYRRDFEEY